MSNEKVGQPSGLFPSALLSNHLGVFHSSGEEFCLFQAAGNEMKLIEPVACKAQFLWQQPPLDSSQDLPLPPVTDLLLQQRRQQRRDQQVAQGSLTVQSAERQVSLKFSCVRKRGK